MELHPISEGIPVNYCILWSIKELHPISEGIPVSLRELMKLKPCFGFSFISLFKTLNKFVL